ncbi:MAG TPA: hypothetical protein VK196_03315 [Magnetospirillum sp.]|nr:hypothetical protein [Magnetospirillum sp.]
MTDRLRDRIADEIGFLASRGGGGRPGLVDHLKAKFEGVPVELIQEEFELQPRWVRELFQ